MPIGLQQYLITVAIRIKRLNFNDSQRQLYVHRIIEFANRGNWSEINNYM